MKKILVIDDENRTRELIIKMIASFNFDLEIIDGGDSVALGIQSIQKHQPDLVFLDIQMPDGTGFDVLKSIEKKNFEVIFITAHEEFAINAIKFSALDYILKPIDIEELQSAVERAIQTIDDKKSELQFEALQNNFNPAKKRKLVVKTSDSIYVVDLEDIIRFEADKNYTNIFFTNGKKILIAKTLKEYESMLDQHHFFRIQQSHLINLNYIDRYEKGKDGCVIMKDGSEIPLSPNKREQFFKILENL